MAKYYLVNKYDSKSKQYIKNEFEVTEHDKIITGKIKLYATYGPEKKPVNENLNFIAFKGKINEETYHALLYNEGSIEVTDSQISLNAYEYKDKESGKLIVSKKIQLIILEASIPSNETISGKVKPKKSSNVKNKSKEDEEEVDMFDDEIPF